MRKSLLATTAASLLLVPGLPGCSQKTDASTELEKAAKAMEQAESETKPAAPETRASSNQAQETGSVKRQMNQAMTAYKSGNLQDTVTCLQQLRAQPTLSGQQLMALQDAMAAVMGDIYARAANGDAQAKLAVKQYEAMQNARHH